MFLPLGTNSSQCESLQTISERALLVSYLYQNMFYTRNTPFCFLEYLFQKYVYLPGMFPPTVVSKPKNGAVLRWRGLHGKSEATVLLKCQRQHHVGYHRQGPWEISEGLGCTFSGAWTVVEGPLKGENKCMHCL